jgi:hypothetical protein
MTDKLLHAVLRRPCRLRYFDYCRFVGIFLAAGGSAPYLFVRTDHGQHHETYRNSTAVASAASTMATPLTPKTKRPPEGGLCVCR